MSLTSKRSFTLSAVVLVAALTGCGGTAATAAPPAATVPPPAATAAPPAATAAAPTAVAAATNPAASVPVLSTPIATTAAPTCPDAATVNAALGVTLPEPIGVAGGGANQLPAGATAVACEYHGASYNVIIELLSNIIASYITSFTGKFPVPAVSVSGLGDQAQSFSQSLNGGKDNEGVVASKGSTMVDITATDTPATLAQIEALISTLL